MSGIAGTVRLVGAIGAWGAAIVASFVTFLFVGIVVIGAGSMNLGTVTVLIIVALVAGKLTYSAVLHWVGRRAVLIREQERLSVEAHQRQVEALADEARRKAAWDADAPRRQAEWEADAPRREAALKAAEEQKAREAQIRTEIETRVRIEREVAAAENARRATVQQAQYAQQVATYNQQVAANNKLQNEYKKWWGDRLTYLRDVAARAAWLPPDLHELLKIRAKTTPMDQESIRRLDLLIESLAPLEPALRKSSRNSPDHDLVIAQARRLLA